MSAQRVTTSTEQLAFDVRQAGKALGLSTSYVRLLVKRREILFIRIGKRILFPRDLEAWLEKHRKQPRGK